MGARGRAKVRVQRGIGRSVATETRGQSIRARGAAKMLAVSSSRVEATSGRLERSGRGISSHGSRAHAVGRGSIHGGWVARISNHSGARTTGAASQTADILGEIVVAAHLIAALPVTSAEWNDARAAHAAVTAAMAMVAHVGRGGHHGRWAVAVAVTHLAGGAGANSRERASEAGSPALEVGEAAARAGPVTGPGPVLAGRERHQDLLGSVQDSTRGRGYLDGLFVEGAAVHAEALGCLEEESASGPRLRCGDGA